MKKIWRIFFTIFISLFCLKTVYASIPNTNQPVTFLGPSLRLGFTNMLSDITAYSFLGELGPRNMRLGGTIGWLITDDQNQRIKLSAEALRQNITYSFITGDTSQWVNQLAIGADYQYNFEGFPYKQFDLNGYYSYAPSTTLRNEAFTTTVANTLTLFNVTRRIAGSKAGGISPGINVEPWRGTRAGVSINYDVVYYDKKFSPNEDAKGFGGTVHIDQALTDSLNLRLSAADRKPFNNYAADLAWTDLQFYGLWSLGLFGEYTAGKNTLPDTYNVGVSADYFFDKIVIKTPPTNFKGETNFSKDDVLTSELTNGFLSWTADPAVYMPQVLAIADSGTCILPTFSGTIPTLLLAGMFNAAPFFHGVNLHFRLSISPAPAPADLLVINATTGVIHYDIETTTIYTVRVIASNSCGPASSNAFTVAEF